MFWKKRKEVKELPRITAKVVEDLEKAFGMSRYYTDSGVYEGTARLQHTPMFSIRIPDEDTIHVIECKNSLYGTHHLVDGYTMADYSYVNRATYLYATDSRQLYIIKDGTVTFQKEYMYILNKEDFFQYIQDDETYEN